MIKFWMFLALLSFFIIVWPFLASYLVHHYLAARAQKALEKILKGAVTGIKPISLGFEVAKEVETKTVDFIKEMQEKSKNASKMATVEGLKLLSAGETLASRLVKETEIEADIGIHTG